MSQKPDYCSCKTIPTNQGTFFLLVAWHESVFDIQVSNAVQCWESAGSTPHAPMHHALNPPMHHALNPRVLIRSAIAGVTAPSEHAFSPGQWLAHAKEALYDLDCQRCFEFEVEENGGSLQVCLWRKQGQPGSS